MNVEQKFQVVENGAVNLPKGFQTSGLACGVKKSGNLDLGWLISEVPATAAAVYTTNLFQAAPIQVTKESIAQEGKLQAVLVNSGNANACTGEPGVANAYELRNQFAKIMNIPAHYVAVASTGVIGEQLPMEKLSAGIQEIPNTPIDEQGEKFAQAILTTDTFAKQVAVQVEIEGKTITIAGATKGSGMINPNMATMLGFMTTDANITQEALTHALRAATQKTFNMITVDGDTSTNDTVVVLANGLAENNALNQEHADWAVFMAAFTYVAQELAKKIARDGEGATKLVEVEVHGAVDDQAAQVIAKTIVGSNLVKAAIYGTDPNWGRIICAAGYSGTAFDPNKVKVSIGPVTVVDNGLPLDFSKEEAVEYLKQEQVHIDVYLQEGTGKAVAWGCDLTYDYVKINAMYTT